MFKTFAARTGALLCEPCGETFFASFNLFQPHEITTASLKLSNPSTLQRDTPSAPIPLPNPYPHLWLHLPTQHSPALSTSPSTTLDNPRLPISSVAANSAREDPSSPETGHETEDPRLPLVLKLVETNDEEVNDSPKPAMKKKIVDASGDEEEEPPMGKEPVCRLRRHPPKQVTPKPGRRPKKNLSHYTPPFAEEVPLEVRCHLRLLGLTHGLGPARCHLRSHGLSEARELVRCASQHVGSHPHDLPHSPRLHFGSIHGPNAPSIGSPLAAGGPAPIPAAATTISLHSAPAGTPNKPFVDSVIVEPQGVKRVKEFAVELNLFVG
ncbi:hypothetical protein BDK51DRAFT_29201 [Blyttiomyces helicus]|uniref:Uncharacterized protein n=1 Tax=Blyttiomyces helicus TaxID=388810 RepID=A0A4P9W931_9FUNG|nr:hypothetical protein BDK51DRAFT_29201 [Blyttiomyces helicus]|eukprot:RKO89051.1 hypothetical protein BDK51DRAFT_29201 [Blyttiomyces helicus]